MKILVMYENSGEAQAAIGLARLLTKQGGMICTRNAKIQVEIEYSGRGFDDWDRRQPIIPRVEAVAGPFEDMMFSDNNLGLTYQRLLQPVPYARDGKPVTMPPKPKPGVVKPIAVEHIPTTIRQIDFEDLGMKITQCDSCTLTTATPMDSRPQRPAEWGRVTIESPGRTRVLDLCPECLDKPMTFANMTLQRTER